VGDTYGIVTGNLTGITASNFSVAATPALSGQSYTVTQPGGPGTIIDIVVGNSGPVYTSNLTWNGTDANKVNTLLWDTSTSANWNNGSLITVYNAGDNVTFNDANGGAADYAVTLNTTVTPGSVTVNNSLGNYTINGTGKIVDNAAMTKSGTSSLSVGIPLSLASTLNISAGTLAVTTGGNLNVAGATTLTGNYTQTAGTATFAGVNGTGTVALSGGTTTLAFGSGVSSMGALTITTGTTGGSLDLTNNHAFINYGSGSDPIASIQAYIKSGYNAGNWNGTGIISSTARTPANGLYYGVGYADSADANNPAGLASGQIEVKYTLLGDANLDNTVNSADLAILGANYNSNNVSWDQGDFNYDGTVNSADFSLLAQNFNDVASNADVSAGDIAALDAFAAANGLALPTISSVPEPASLGLLGMAMIGLMPRRRRRA
jgi:hypothetical protein